MKYCSNCGKEIQNLSNFCENCGKNLKEENFANNTINSENAKGNINNAINEPKVNNTNGLAITGFVISLVSLLCCGGTSFIGLIFSIIGLVESKKKNGNGKGLAIAGIIINAILLVLLVALYILGFGTTLIEELSSNSNSLPGYYY